MRILKVFCLATVVAGVGLCQTSAKPEPKFKPSVDIVTVDYRYAQPTGLRSVRDVDFANLKVVVLDDHGKPFRTIPFNHGRAEWRDTWGNEADIGGIYFFEDRKHTGERALIEVGWLSVGGSSSQTDYVMVFETHAGNLYATQQISYDAHAQWWTLSKFYPESATLIVLGRTEDDSPHCCPKSLDEVMFNWNRDRFDITDAQRLFVEQNGCGGAN